MAKIRRESYCYCSRWRRFTHFAVEHVIFEERARILTPRRWKREHPMIEIPEGPDISTPMSRRLHAMLVPHDRT